MVAYVPQTYKYFIQLSDMKNADLLTELAWEHGQVLLYRLDTMDILAQAICDIKEVVLANLFHPYGIRLYVKHRTIQYKFRGYVNDYINLNQALNFIRNTYAMHISDNSYEVLKAIKTLESLEHSRRIAESELIDRPKVALSLLEEYSKEPASPKPPSVGEESDSDDEHDFTGFPVCTPVQPPPAEIFFI